MKEKQIILCLIAISIAAPAAAAETITYTYDAKGRVAQVVHSGTVNNGVAVTYVHDKADNRQTVTTTP